MNTLHIICGGASLLFGLLVFWWPKGTLRHKIIGRAYALSMLLLVFSSFFVFELFGRIGAFHILSLVSLLTLLIGVAYPMFFRDKQGKWLNGHYFWMGYSYVGLVMATGSHLFGMVPSWPEWLRIMVFWALPYLSGTILIYSYRKKLVNQQMARLYPRKEIPEREEKEIKVM